jgi:hypothetical protein
MGSILKVRQLTTFAEGAILTLGVALVLVIVYFAMGKGVGPSKPVVDSVKVTIDSPLTPIQLLQKAFQYDTSKTVTPSEPTPVSVLELSKKTVKVVKQKPKPKAKPTEKPVKKGERENLNISNF